MGRERDAIAAALRGALSDLARCVRFYSRLPVPPLPWEDDPHAVPDFRTMPRALPVAALIIALPGVLVFAGAAALGLGPFLAGALAVAALTLATGAFHEDGLADAADGLGGGTTPERRLAIMKDSRIGSYGAAALILAFLLRIGALATLADRTGLLGVAGAILAAATLSRTAALIQFGLIPPARSGGAAYDVGQPGAETLGIALGLAIALGALLTALAGLPWSGLVLAVAGAGAGALAMTHLSRRLIGGHTGDVAGATQQVAEILVLLAFVGALGRAPGP